MKINKMASFGYLFQVQNMTLRTIPNDLHLPKICSKKTEKIKRYEQN